MIAEVIIFILFFIIGVVLGSFFTLATYRIPLKQDITHTRSYCPKCNHRLNFLDLIPILSFVFLGGKCRYCKEKINPRYIIMEIFSGVLYLLLIVLAGIDFIHISAFQIIKLVYITLMFSVLFINCGILKETKKVSTEVLLFGIIVQILYITYLYILKLNIYRYIIYLIIMLVLLFLGVMQKRQREK